MVPHQDEYSNIQNFILEVYLSIKQEQKSDFTVGRDTKEGSVHLIFCLANYYDI